MTHSLADRHAMGFARVAGAVPTVQLAQPAANAHAAFDLCLQAGQHHVDVLIFPELNLTGYTCADLFFQHPLLEASRHALADLCQQLQSTPAPIPSLIAVGLPWAWNTDLYNVAAIIADGRVIGMVPKQHIPNYKEYYERRWFQSGAHVVGQSFRDETLNADAPIAFGVDLLFQAEQFSSLVIGVEICEDVWVPQPPSAAQALAGATVLANLSASVLNVGKADYRRDLVTNQSARCVAGYIYSASGIDESSTDFVFDGHALIAVNGRIRAESQRFSTSPTLTMVDVDVQQLQHDRWQMSTFTQTSARGTPADQNAWRCVPFTLNSPTKAHVYLTPAPNAHPFVPADNHQRALRCDEIFQIQVAGLGRRLQTVKPTKITLGVSGGLDSTWALLVTHHVLQHARLENSEFVAITMPGFGTSNRTLENARALMDLLGLPYKTIDIRPQSFDTFQQLQHQPFGIDLSNMSMDEFQKRLHDLPADNRHDLVFENVQARMRTLNLMSEGFVIGTGDLSELALGWCTYNADHMSMYNPNVSIPKTLIQFLVRWWAEAETTDPNIRDVLHSIVETEISPELLPIAPDQKIQSTEEKVGPYELNDFFLYHVLRNGNGPRKIFYLAQQADFHQAYDDATIVHWLRLFYRRFFTSQYKRSCLPDGPKVGSVSLSPRGDWRMPSDAQATAWLAELKDFSS